MTDHGFRDKSRLTRQALPTPNRADPHPGRRTRGKPRRPVTPQDRVDPVTNLDCVYHLAGHPAKDPS